MRTPASRVLAAGALCGLVALATALSSCTKTSPFSASPNLAPETTLTARGEPAAGGGRQVCLQWLGTDEDGSVDHYLVRLDSQDWCEVTSTESVYVFAGRGKRPRLIDEEERHSFAVKAVDDRGAEDPTPSVVWFTPRNSLPETEIVHGPAAITGPMVGFEWVGYDYDGVIAAYDYRLFRWDGGGAEWVQVLPDPAIAPSVTVGPEVTTVLFGPLAGMHRFEVWSTDNEGGVDPTPAESIFTCNPELAGARLTVATNVLGTHVYRGAVWPNSYNTATDVFPEHLAFEWDADASDYGGQVVGFRYAYDDTSYWPPWSLEETSFEVTPEPGEHSLYINVLDNANVMTRGRIFVNVVDAGFSDYIVLVDDYDQQELYEPAGTDEDRDAFYDSLLCCYDRPVTEWDPEEHQIGGVPQPPDVVTLASASTVVWYADGMSSVLSEVFHSFEPGYVPLAGYMRAGGNLVLCGWEVLGSIMNEDYPITVTAQDSSAAAVFVRDCLGIGHAENSGAEADKGQPWNYGYCFYGAVPGGTGIPSEATVQLEPMYVDSLGKWWFMYDHIMEDLKRCGLPAVDAVTPFDGSAIESHEIDAFLNMNFEGETCVLLSPTGSTRGNVCYLGFPLYYLKTAQVKAFFDDLMPLFGETAIVPAGVEE